MSSLQRQPVLTGGKEIHANHGRTRIITSHEKEKSPDHKELYNVAGFSQATSTQRKRKGWLSHTWKSGQRKKAL